MFNGIKTKIYIRNIKFSLLRMLGLSHQWSIFKEHGIYFFIMRQKYNGTQWDSKKQISLFQNKYLRRIITYAYKNVPYYRKIFDLTCIDPHEIKEIKHLKNIPILDKETVRLNSFDLQPKNYSKFRPVVHRTSGSTGKPLEILVDAQLESLGASLVWRYFNWGGYYFNKRMVLFGAPFGFNNGKLDLENLWKYDKSINTLHINTGLLKEKNIELICRKIMEFNPEYIRVYPSIAYLISLYLQKYPEIKINPKAIFTWSEKLYSQQKQLIEQAFGCKVYEFYGMWEYLIFAFACPYGKMHITPEMGILEILKNNNEECNEGEVGELVCTSLHNRSMPLIRYATKDYGYIDTNKCACGRNSSVLTIVGCRDKDLIVTNDGIVNVMSGTPWFNKKSRIKHIQFYQEKKGEVIVKIVPDFGFNEGDMNSLENNLDEYFNKSVKTTFQIVNDIPRTKAGKYKYVESKVPIQCLFVK